MTPHNSLNKAYSLQSFLSFGNNKDTTINRKRQSRVLNIAFFVSKKYTPSVFNDMKNRIHKSNMVGSRGFNKIPFSGNKSRCLAAVVEARSPVKTNAGGHLLTKPQGGQTMPNTSKRAAIRTIQTITTPGGIIATIHTRYNQKAVIGRLFTFFEQLKSFLLAQGLSLDLLGGRI